MMAADERLRMLRRMLLIRAFEERVMDLFRAGTIYGHVHLYIGQEAVAVGTCSRLQEDDYVTSTHRGHGHCLAKGADPRRMMAELFGRRTGYCKGKDGSMHIADVQKGVLGANGIVAGSVPTAVGVALGRVLQGQDNVVACFFGEGALNQGVLHESMNLAAIWKLPVIFVCENNRYATTTSVETVMAGPGIEARGAAYGIPARTVDGMDVMAVADAVDQCVVRARSGGGPSLLGMETYRFRGHTEGEEKLGWGQYRSDQEISEWRSMDPISRLEQQLREEGALTDGESGQVREEVRSIIDEAVVYAQQSPEPEPDDVWDDVFTPAGG